MEGSHVCVIYPVSLPHYLVHYLLSLSTSLAPSSLFHHYTHMRSPALRCKLTYSVCLHYHVCPICFVIFRDRFFVVRSLAFSVSTFGLSLAETILLLEVFIKQQSEVIYCTRSDVFLWSACVCVCLQDSASVNELET